MKAQFKYALRAGLYMRCGAFAAVFLVNTLFIILGTMGLLPLGVHILSVTLGGLAVAAMLAANIGGDVAIARRMFSSPEAYLHALTPVPRWKILLASIVTMAVMDLVTMTFVIVSQTWIVFNLLGDDFKNFLWNTVSTYAPQYMHWLWGIPYILAGYFLILMIILFCVTSKMSIFYRLPGATLLSLLLACACFYANNILQLVLAPFGTVELFGIYIIITVSGKIGLPVFTFLTLAEAAALFYLTSKLMERRMNI
jgi:hypothetical protein